MDNKSLNLIYSERQAQYKKLVDVAQYQLEYAIKSQRINIHSLIPRIKKFESFVDKMRRKNLKDPFNEIHDLVGLRVVCLFLSDVEKVGNLIKNTFELIREDNKIDSDAKDVFGYMDVQYIVTLKKNVLVSKEVTTIPFEIQVRTIVQDAWASISYDLDYKKEKNIPEHLRRDFYALSGLFYVADTHFQRLREEQQNPKEVKK